MPSKSEKQRNFIFSLRDKYKNIEHTPEKYKWVWEKEWETIEESKSIKLADLLYTYNEIISKEEWKDENTKYNKYFYKTFSKEDYKKSIKHLTELFKKMNGGKLSKTIVFDYNEKNNKINSIDKKVINILFNLDYDINKNNYMQGVCYKNGKEVDIISILNSFGSKKLEQLEDTYNKTKQINVKKQIDAFKELKNIKIIYGNKIDLSKLSIYSKSRKIVFSYDHRIIASQSTNVGWSSCMNMDDGAYNYNVGSGTSDGVFIAFLVKSGDEKELKNPTARILFKPFISENKKDYYWLPDTVYGTAPTDFQNVCKNIVNKYQGETPKLSQLYNLGCNTYQDDLRSELDNRDDKKLLKVIMDDGNNMQTILQALDNIKEQKSYKYVYENKEEQDNVVYAAIKRITDEDYLKKIFNDSKSSNNTKIASLNNIKDQNFLKEIALKENSDNVLQRIIEKIDDVEEVLNKLINNNYNNIDNINYSLLESIVESTNNQKTLINIFNNIKNYENIKIKNIISTKITDQDFIKEQLEIREKDFHSNLINYTIISNLLINCKNEKVLLDCIKTHGKGFISEYTINQILKKIKNKKKLKEIEKFDLNSTFKRVLKDVIDGN